MLCLVIPDTPLETRFRKTIVLAWSYATNMRRAIEASAW
jgi:hypothetical protein